MEIEVRFVKGPTYEFKKGIFVSISEDDKISLTCGTFISKFASKILSGLNLQQNLKRWLTNPKSFRMKFSALNAKGNTFSFSNANKDHSLQDILKGEAVIFMLQNISREEESHFTDNAHELTEEDSNEDWLDQPNVKTLSYLAAFEGPASVPVKHPGNVFTINVVYIKAMADGTENVNCRIAMELLTSDIENITFGKFLAKFGNDILSTINPDGSSAIVGESFPMKLSFYEVFDLGEIFNNVNRDNVITWQKHGSNTLWLEHIETREANEFKLNVTNPKSMQSQFPQQASKIPHLEVLHRLNNLLDTIV